MRDGLRAAIDGIVAAGSGIAAAELFAAAIRPGSGPLVTVIDATGWATITVTVG
ncbi:hypothetical protein Acy02nite_75110 [Actinoplanes cyaneus]|uniref:Uncharacterized protein n=1 Tax=Actinoplanes cyaneus TaxID=52696 RepID=A0A919IP38_9ACTN|nr:hypothetical protein [Actinoplanes cyaneus]MCW2142938.1 hypothetical protein [Actinoplanes cyaneus]GID69630.1 hypothetical protein Acy02nite_75110 [Actinoplanes cyaneus]